MFNSQVVILDFGSQYSNLVARVVRDLGIFCHIVPYDCPLENIIALQPQAIILSGGPSSVYDTNALLVSKDYLDLGIPILGICYGMQLIVKLLHGVVAPHKKEYGKSHINILDRDNKIFENIPYDTQVWMSHGDCISSLPPTLKVTATSGDIIAAIQHINADIYGLQFHPEVTHTTHGKAMLSNFLFNIAKCKPDWQMQDFITDKVSEIKSIVGDKHVVLGLSGGVDSSVAALLISKAIPKQLTCVFVDTGLLRENETENIKSIFTQHFHLNIKYIDAKSRFLNALKGVTDPEEKRKIIGCEFINTFTLAIADISNVDFLAQGTIYPDIIESSTASKCSQVIKSHHNVGGLPKDLKLQLLEPLKYLFKDEVKKIGKILDLPDSLLQRHPFPGPGLGIRVIGEVTAEKIAILQKADSIFIEELMQSGWYHKTSQACVILLPVYSVGVKGDNRSYELTAVLRAVNSIDFMTAEVSQLPFELITKIVNRIVNEVKGINRVLYDFTTKPPATIEWE